MRPDAVMIFAAGFGTRMGALTKDRPKPLIELAGRTLLDRTLDLADAAGLRRRVVNAHYLAEQVETHLNGTGIPVSRETGEILDTGGGLKAALPLLGRGTLFTANPDVAWRGPNPFDVLADHGLGEADALLLVVDSATALGRSGNGDFTLDVAGRVSRKGPWLYAGIQLIRSASVADYPDRIFSLNRVWDELIAQGKLRAVPYPGQWCDVGTPEGLKAAEAILSGATHA